jgi:cytochrome c5
LSTHDRRFFDIFMLILGILIAVAVGIYLLAESITDRTPGAESEAVFQAEVRQRIAPIGEVVMPGEEAAARAEAETVPTPTPVAATLSGPQVYNQACIACHGAGVAGAPVVGDASVWEARIAKGMETLYDHSLNGFQGDAGYMPPKGGRTDLSDEEVVAAVDYMVEESR